jgi:hypothetical protein
MGICVVGVESPCNGVKWFTAQMLGSVYTSQGNNSTYIWIPVFFRIVTTNEQWVKFQQIGTINKTKVHVVIST